MPTAGLARRGLSVAACGPVVAAAVILPECTDELAAWAIARQRPQAVGPYVTPVSIPLGALDDMNRYYVVCTRDRAIPLALQRRMIAESVCADVVRNH